MTLMETMQTMDGGLTEREKDIRRYLLDLLASMVFSQDYAHNMEHNARYEAFGRDNLWPLMEEKPYKK